MGMLSSLFGRKADEGGIRTLAGALFEAGYQIVNQSESCAYQNQKVIVIATTAEAYSALLHYTSRVSLHVGGAAFQDAIYGKVRDKLSDTFATVIVKFLAHEQGRSVSPKAAAIELEELFTKRELEYANHSGGYGDKATQKESLIWTIAKNIHNATGISVSNKDEAIVAIGDVFAKSISALELDNKLQSLHKEVR